MHQIHCCRVASIDDWEWEASGRTSPLIATGAELEPVVLLTGESRRTEMALLFSACYLGFGPGVLIQ